MAEKYQYIEELSEQVLKSLSKRDTWIQYLRTAANLYKYSFRDSYLIFAQRPDATAVASYDLWNDRMHRYINRGSKGIALIDRKASKPHLHYVFDISDTHGDRIPYIWQFKNEYADRVIESVSDSMEISPEATFDATVETTAAVLVQENIPELLSELKEIKTDSYLSDLDDQNLEVMLRKTLTESIRATVLIRCGQTDVIGADDFSHLYNFNSPDTMILLGRATSELSESILREIELTVKTIEREQRNNERSKQYGTDVHREKRTAIPERADEGSDQRTADEVRTGGEGLSGETASDSVRHHADERNAVLPLQGDGTADKAADDSADQADESADAAQPMADTDRGDRERADSGADTEEITEQDAIDTVLLRGSGFESGKQRIIDYYFANPSNKDHADLLKKEYGIGGGTVIFSESQTGFQNHDAKGIEIFPHGFDGERIKLTWSKAAKRIGELIDNERYFEQRHPHEKPLIKPTVEPSTESKGADEAPFSMAYSETDQKETETPTQKKRRTQSQMNFARLEKLVPHIMDKRYRHATLTADGFMDLTVEWIAPDRIALAHYGEQNGDRMADPDMELIVDLETKNILPATYQNNYVGVYQEVYSGDNQWKPKLSKELTSFLNTWLRNIEFQGHVLTKAIYMDSELESKPVVLDEQGREYGLDIPHDMFSMAQLEEQTKQAEKEEPDDKRADLPDATVRSEPETVQDVNEPDTAPDFEIDAELQDELFKATLKLQITIEGKQHIIDSFNGYNDSFTYDDHIENIKAEYGAIGMTFDFEGKQRKFQASNDGLCVYPDSASKEVYTEYTWDEVSDGISSLIRANEYAERPDLLSKLDEGQVIQLGDRSYQITRIDYMNDKIQLDDRTFAEGTGIPIMRSDRLSNIEQQLEAEGFFNPQEKEDHVVDEKPEVERINFHITDNNLGVGGAKEKYNRNVTAIRLLKQIESEDRLATAEEQEVLSQYVGWGGLARAFNESDNAWSDEYTELNLLLDETEYKAARASTLNAHYTSPVVIRAIYSALENMGFSGGNILEPAMGVGNFMGLLPPSLSELNMYGVELDSISGRIAQQLYQRENVQVSGFEHTAFHDNFFDIAIGNIPFGAYGIADKRYDKHNFLIHDYFFAKALDKVRPGGIVAMISSKGTLDKQNSSVRKYIAQRAELVGAIRLPNNAFKANAGTDVTSDIIFLKKRDSIQDIEPDWVQLGETTDGVPINQYFVDNPHMVLGQMQFWKGMYGNDKETACVPFENADLQQQLHEAVPYIEAEIDDGYMVDEPDANDTSILADPSVKNYSFTIVDNKLYYRENSRMNLYETNATAEKRIKGMIKLSKTLHTLIDYQIDGYGEHQIRNMQMVLNDKYDAFVEAHGRINDRANRLAFSDDSDYYLLSSLENLDDDGNFDSKADIFTKQTIRARKQITHVDTSSEALAVSIANRAKVDIGYMRNLTGKAPETIISDLKGVIFKDPLSDLKSPYDGYITADEYLSGNVRDKLRTVKLMAEKHPEFTYHVPVLEAVQPEDLEAGDITVRLGTVWIPTNYVQQFIYELLETPYYARGSIEVEYSKYTGSWYVSNKSYDGDSVSARETYGTQRINAYQIIEETLNQKTVRITDKVVHPDGKEEYVLNKKQTFLASQKQNQIKEAFKDWIFLDAERRKTLVSYYNEHFNNIRPREYNGEHLVFEGMNPEIELREHQRNAVARQLYGGNTLLAHVVGAGKSFTMIAAAMESKRLGLSTKNMITVPNHLTEQIAAETLRLYPSAKVLVTTKKDFQKHNRKRFCSKIATGDYDIIVIGHSQFEKVPLSTERQIRTIQKEIDDIAYAVVNERRYGGTSFNVKQMERTKKSLEKTLEKLNDQTRKDDVVTFEELGIDRLFVDEAHMFKNLFVFSKMRNVAGVQQTQAQKAMDMYMKCRYLDEITGGKGITFATGTPISNSMVEMYTVQRYLQMHELEKRDLHHFDNWASVFGETQTAYELAPEGDRFRMKTRFSRFHNLPELMAMFKEVADVQTNDMLNLPIPALKGGKPQIVTVKASEIQRSMIAELAERAEAVRNGDVDPVDDNMLKVTNDGRKIALDQRLANVCLPDDANSKINALMQNVYDTWKSEASSRAAQIVFCDLSTPKYNGEFNVYEDLKQKWINKGIPEEQIAFIHDANNERQKASLFAKVRSGDVRIILGSTFKMGSGVNIQDRLIAVHHADATWKPSGMEQRDGRILRQGNMNDEVSIYRYVTENTFDSYSWQLLEQKQRFISQIMTSKTPVRSADDIDEAVLSYAEVKALAAGNPKIKERMELDVEVNKLIVLKAEHKNRTYRLQEQVSTRLPEQIKAMELRIQGYEADVKASVSFIDADFAMTINGAVYDEKKDAGEMILALAKQVHKINGQVIGSYGGFKMTINADSLFRVEPYIQLRGTITHTVHLGDDVHGNITRLDNAIKGLPDQLERCQQELEGVKTQLEKAKSEVDKPFAQAFELKEKTSRLEKLNHELSMNKKDQTMEIEDSEQPEPEKTIAGMER